MSLKQVCSGNTCSFENISICIPAYNEEASIGECLRELIAVVPEAEIIVVDDGSTDSTAEIASCYESVTLVRHDRNKGYGASLKTAFRQASGDTIVWYDADGQHSPADLKKVAAPVVNGEKDAVIGARDATSAQAKGRGPGKTILKLVAMSITHQDVPDLNSGLRAFTKRFLGRYLHMLPDGFSASTTTTLILMKRSYRLEYVPIHVKPRKGVSTVKMLRDGWGALRLMLRLGVLFNALEFFGALALVQIIPALIYGVILAFVKGQGLPVLASTFFLSGVLTFFLGVVCDQITSLRLELMEK